MLRAEVGGASCEGGQRQATYPPDSHHPGAPMAWHYSIEGEEYGPFEAAEFRRLADSGAFGSDDLVRQDGAPQ